MQKVTMISNHHTMPVAVGVEGVLVKSDKKHNYVYWPTEDTISKHLLGKSIETQKFGFLEHNEKLVAKRALERHKEAIADKVKSRKSNSASTAKLGSASNGLDIVNSEMGAVSAIMSDVQYTPLQEAVIMNNLTKLVERCRVKFGMNELMLMGDGVDKAEETMQSINEIRAQIETLGASFEDLLKL
ncbi:hypothetical protein PVA23_35 [Vibrio phage PVA23]|nr:hypothetical protein PVA23_35 [Vibrio phage PVA23]